MAGWAKGGADAVAVLQGSVRSWPIGHLSGAARPGENLRAGVARGHQIRTAVMKRIDASGSEV
jgi:hypothetical protein